MLTLQENQIGIRAVGWEAFFPVNSLLGRVKKNHKDPALTQTIRMYVKAEKFPKILSITENL